MKKENQSPRGALEKTVAELRKEYTDFTRDWKPERRCEGGEVHVQHQE
jgi:hypothetical protein